jgi:hypothetical protein
VHAVQGVSQVTITTSMARHSAVRLSSFTLVAVFAGATVAWSAPGGAPRAPRVATVASKDKDKDKGKEKERQKGDDRAQDDGDTQGDGESGKDRRGDNRRADNQRDSGQGDDGDGRAPSAVTPGSTTPEKDGAGKGDRRRKQGAGSGGDDPKSTTPAFAKPAVGAPTPAAEALAAPSVPLPAPELGQTAGVAAVQGDVLVRAGDGGPIRPLDGAAKVPTGTVVDARQGTIDVVTAVDSNGATQTARFWGGIFEVRQGRGAATHIVLRHGDFSGCSGARAANDRTGAHAAKKRKPIRSLWGSDHHGKYQTRGRGSVATVRGTQWLTEDYCDGTRTTVVEGEVAVRDLQRKRTVIVKAGHSYFAARHAG